MRAEQVVPALERLDGGLAEQGRGGSGRRERVGAAEADGEREEAVQHVGQQGAEELRAHEELVGDDEREQPHVGVGLGHEGEEDPEGVADGAVGGAGGGLDGAEEGRVDGGGGGGGGAVDEGRDGGLRRGGRAARGRLAFRRRAAGGGGGGARHRRRLGAAGRGRGVTMRFVGDG